MTDEPRVDIVVTRSAGTDGAVVVFIDTVGFLPSGNDRGPGLRVLVNGAKVADGPGTMTPFEGSGDPWDELEARERHFTVRLSDVDYVEDQYDRPS